MFAKKLKRTYLSTKKQFLDEEEEKKMKMHNLLFSNLFNFFF